MVVVFSANVAQGVPINGVVTLTFTDTTTGLGTIVSRTLVITNSEGDVVATINMGVSLTATYNIISDGYYEFAETIVDNVGTYNGQVNFLSTAFYQSVFPQLVSNIQNECDTTGQIFNLTRAELYKSSAITFGLYGQGVNAQANIDLANFYLNTPYYAD